MSNYITDRKPVSPASTRAMQSAPTRIKSIERFVDLGVMGDEVEVAVNYVLNVDEVYGLYPEILTIVIRDRTCNFYGRDIYGDKFSKTEENTILEEIKVEEEIE